MRRRRRPEKEIHFSFDSFLDVVANVVGIIIKLILVAWVGARTYKGIEIPEMPIPSLTNQISSKQPEIKDPLSEAIAEKVKEKQKVIALLTGRTHKINEMVTTEPFINGKIYELNKSLKSLLEEEEKMTSKLKESESNEKNQVISLSQVKKRTEDLNDEINNFKKTKGPKNELKYKTPVSRTLQSEELIFECRNGRITPVDIGTMLEEISGKMQELGEKLRKQWELEELSQNYGAFKLRYTIEREKTGIEMATPNSLPDDRSNFRFALTGWVLESLDPDRGETLEQALKPDSEFMKIINSLDHNQTAVTFCVYPDSFGIYRRVRDLIHEKQIVVAGRPLNFDAPIAMSVKKGTASRGQ